MRIASVIVLVLVATLFVGWWGWVRAPAPQQVCEHVVEVTMRETASRGLDPQTRTTLVQATRSQCEQLAHDKLQLRGRLKYATWAKCMSSAKDVAGFGHC